MYTIENEDLKVSVNEFGAELASIYSKPLGIEYMWNADPSYWAKQSPILFPIVGGLKNNSYFFAGNQYKLPRHGFAREKLFSVTDHSKESLSFSLHSDEDTQKVYPFHFELKITYRLKGNTVTVAYYVTNPGNKTMYFSIGGHPAFKVPLIDGSNYEDYYLEFNRKENARRWVVSREGLIDINSIDFLKNQSILPLTKGLFLNDALVFKDLVSDEVALKSSKHPHGLDFNFPGFPFMGLWAAKNADFVCIEPWCGIADSVDTDQDFTIKRGSIDLKRAMLSAGSGR